MRGGSLGQRAAEWHKQRRLHNLLLNITVFIPFLPQVFLAMVDKRVELDKSLVAHLAVVRPQAFVETYVQPNVGRAHKGAAADAALQVPRAAFRLGPRERRGRLARGLCRFVSEQHLQGAEALTALLTLVRSVARVQANVRQEAGLLREGLVAVGALEGLLPRVQAAVGLEMRGPDEALAALGAFERAVSAVGHLVRHQVGRLVEVLAADAAFVLPLLVVGGEVKVQVGRGDERFAAAGAAVRFQACASVRLPAVGGVVARLARVALGTTGHLVRVVTLAGVRGVVRGGLRRGESAATFGALLHVGASFVPRAAVCKQSWRGGCFTLVWLHIQDLMCNNADGYSHISM